jgi:IS1 family transposase
MSWKRLSAQKNKIWLWTAVDHFQQGILGWVLGDHSAKTFEPSRAIVSTWQCYFYVTDGWSVYPGFIPEGEQIISKTAAFRGGFAYMTRVEGENTRLRHYLARLHRKTLCYSRVRGNAETLNSIATALSQILGCPGSSMIHITIQQRPKSYRRYLVAS